MDADKPSQKGKWVVCFVVAKAARTKLPPVDRWVLNRSKLFIRNLVNP